jgi:hypothetical protein
MEYRGFGGGGGDEALYVTGNPAIGNLMSFLPEVKLRLRRSLPKYFDLNDSTLRLHR